MKIGNCEYDFNNKTHVMGILNVTPNSFSDGGEFISIEAAVGHAKKMVAYGADIIDVGGESTHPCANHVSLEEELSRVIPVIKALVREIEVPISIDTYKGEVARLALTAGADMINDVTGTNGDEAMAKVAAESNAPIILMQNRDIYGYDYTVDEIITDLKGSVSKALTAGIQNDKIILDPGFGFKKNVEQNLELIRNIDKIVELGYPVLVGASRKGTLSKVLDLPRMELMEASLAAHLLAVAKGCQIVRVHDVKETVRAVRMADAILQK